MTTISLTVECDGRKYKTVLFSDDPLRDLHKLCEEASKSDNFIGDSVYYVVHDKWPTRK